jgi:type II secretory ATPase GspE/PulE/Tfp pilus assembly ATPase PilB-like protein
LPFAFYLLPFAVCLLPFAFYLLPFALAFAVVLMDPSIAAAAEPSFPRGPGLYFSTLKLLGVLIVYLLWVRTTWWVDEDSRELQLPTTLWNLLTFGCGLLGLLLVWALPSFLLSFPLLLVLCLIPSLVYANIHNRLVPHHQRVLTERHFKQMLARYLHIHLAQEEEEEESTGPPLRFVGKSFNQNDEDPSRVARAESSKGYKAAREMVYEATKMRATDIHMEPGRSQTAVRFRVDGILQNTDPFSRSMGDAVINIFKVLADMDIIEKRKPQDGSFSALCEGHVVDFRVATAGSVAGEKMVIRVFDRSQQIMNLSRIGMRDAIHEQLKKVVTQPHGMLIVCGPTGSGKSTTLYSSLFEIDRFQRNVMTIENPVECQVHNVTQIEVNLKAGKTFAAELRSMLRQDPDVIMIGEVRDQETAEIACQAAQTGHMVFTTLHANDTVTALIRLLDLGVQPATLASAISAILGQRLVRLLCPECKVRYKPNPEMLRKANLPVQKIKYFYRPPEPDERPRPEGWNPNEPPPACEHCGGTGYHGRTGIFELLVINDRIRELIRQNPNVNAVKQEAVKNGMQYLQEDGLRQVIAGKTSIQELLRVCK